MSLQPFWSALQFLTRIPAPVRLSNEPAVAGLSLLAYPLVGLLIGFFLAGTCWLFPNAPAATQAAIILLLWVLITGALHLDGLADCADAWIGGYASRERTQQILKDPHVGSAAVCVLVTVLLAKFAALQSLLAQSSNFEILLWTPMAGRSAALALLTVSPYANPHGLAAAWLEHLALPLARALLLLVATIIAWRLGFLALLAALLVFGGVRTLSMARLGGVTGDVCGALVELTEMTVLLAMALA